MGFSLQYTVVLQGLQAASSCERNAQICLFWQRPDYHMEATAADILCRMQIRTSIKSLFPKRDCFALVRPMEDEQQLARLETVATSQLRPQFQKVHMPSSLLSVLSEVPTQCSASFEFLYMQRTSRAAQLA